MGKEAEKSQGIARSSSNKATDASVALKMDSTIMALCALAGAMFLWSGTFIAMKVVLTVFHPIFMIFVRMLGSILLLLPFLRHWQQATPYRQGDWRIIALMVLAEPCLYFVFEGYALRYTTASQAGMVTALLPLLVGIGAFFALKERLSGMAWAGFFLAMGGVVWLTLAGENTEAAPHALAGNALEFLAMLMAAVYTLCVRRLVGYPPFFLTAMQSGAGVLFFGLLLVGTDVPLPDTLPSWEPLLALAFLSMATIVAYGLYNIGVARLSAGQAAAWTNLIPAITLLMGIGLLGEHLTVAQCFALIPILSGVALSQIKTE